MAEIVHPDPNIIIYMVEAWGRNSGSTIKASVETPTDLLATLAIVVWALLEEQRRKIYLTTDVAPIENTAKMAGWRVVKVKMKSAIRCRRKHSIRTGKRCPKTSKNFPSSGVTIIEPTFRTPKEKVDASSADRP